MYRDPEAASPGKRGPARSGGAHTGGQDGGSARAPSRSPSPGLLSNRAARTPLTQGHPSPGGAGWSGSSSDPGPRSQSGHSRLDARRRLRSVPTKTSPTPPGPRTTCVAERGAHHPRSALRGTPGSRAAFGQGCGHGEAGDIGRDNCEPRECQGGK